jgi:hypothetical protein
MTTIILTSTVIVNHKKSYLFQTDIKSRIETYLTSILQWLNKTNFKIILVENSGYNFDELNNEKELYKDRFEVITFTESKLEEAKYLENNNSKGVSEIFAINYAFKNSKIIHSSNFIIKVTARYFISDLEKFLSYFDLDKYDCLTQNNRNRCEMIGSHYKNFSQIFSDKNIFTGHVESVYKVRTSKYSKVLICKIFNITETQRGGLNEKFNNI